jgi:membrane fusion protein (multidrug efflux system)
MSGTAFSLTFRRLLADRGRSAVWVLLGAALLLGAWCWWAAKIPVTLYEVSSTARVELDTATYPIQSPLLGRVVETSLRVGQVVRRGEVLVEIDAMPDRLQLQQEQVRERGLTPELLRLRGQAAAEENARAEEQSAAGLAAEEAANRIREAETMAKAADVELARTQALVGENLAPRRELDKAEAEARRLRAAVATLESAAQRVPKEQSTRDRERDVRLQRLYSETATLEAERNTVRAGIERLGYEIERRRVRAPVDGRVGESAILRRGAVVQEGQNLASIVPEGRLLVAAQFPADAAFGRIRAGQTATLRLEGFPWAEFGSVAATVARVAQEVRDGHVRVELDIADRSGFRGKLEHGMPGTVEVGVEHLPPLALLLRTAGQWLTVHR